MDCLLQIEKQLVLHERKNNWVSKVNKIHNYFFHLIDSTVKPRCLELRWVEYHGWLELI